MSSKILYNKESLEIIKCQRKPFGASLPSFNTICKSAFVSEENKELMETCVVDKRLSTKEAREKLRIVEGEAILKPKLKIEVDKEEVQLDDDPNFTIKVSISETLESEYFNKVTLKIEDTIFSIDLKNNYGEQIIQLTDKNLYKIKCADNRFRANKISVEGV